LVQTVLDVPAGNQGADAFEKAIEALLTALFYPALSYPEVQFPLHHGRKRVDIKYTNTDQSGFFWWLAQHYPAAHVFVECKNYTGEVANEELDQLSGRFSPTRGQIGMLVCRQFDNKGRFIERCRDTAQDRRGFVIPLDDDDLQTLVAELDAAEPGAVPSFPLLRERFQMLVM
jgi:hypothetical protein